MDVFAEVQVLGSLIHIFLTYSNYSRYGKVERKVAALQTYGLDLKMSSSN
jgi:hypothetical protein